MRNTMPILALLLACGTEPDDEPEPQTPAPAPSAVRLRGGSDCGGGEMCDGLPRNISRLTDPRCDTSNTWGAPCCAIPRCLLDPENTFVTDMRGRLTCDIRQCFEGVAQVFGELCWDEWGDGEQGWAFYGTRDVTAWCDDAGTVRSVVR